MYGSDNSSNSATATGTVVYLNIEFTKEDIITSFKFKY